MKTKEFNFLSTSFYLLLTNRKQYYDYFKRLKILLKYVI